MFFSLAFYSNWIQSNVLVFPLWVPMLKEKTQHVHMPVPKLSQAITHVLLGVLSWPNRPSHDMLLRHMDLGWRVGQKYSLYGTCPFQTHP